MRRLPMRKIAEALRLKAAGLSTRKIAVSLNVGQSTVSEYLKRAQMAGMSWPLPDGIDEAALERRLFHPFGEATRRGLAQPDWPAVHVQMRQRGVTLSLVWEEYRAAHPDDGYGYSRFCELYRRWEGRLSPTMRQHHVAGERVFVDYAGDTLEIVDGETGEVRAAQILVGVLGTSNYTFVEASWTQSLPDWIGAHVRMLAFFGGVPDQIASDNLKAGVTKACFHEPQINRTYAEMAAHYGTAILPARPYKPRDKAKVEVGVLLVQRWIIARLRKRRFFSLSELNAAIRDLLPGLNGKVTRHLGASRQALFDQLDKPALKPLPDSPYDYADWLERRAGLDYHVEVEKHYYSVPHTLLKKTLWVRIAARTVEIFHEGQRVASHVRTSGNRKHTTVAAHMPASHRRYAGMTPAEISRRAEQIGPNTAALVELILRTKPHPEQGYRACLGIVSLAKPHGRDALEAACLRAHEIGGQSYSSVKSILQNNLHRQRPETPAEGPVITHPNIRGSGYFQ
ncbi:IS21 family transposase [Rhodovulum visakhapatnamense]|nr:IS21 family transposase [Rhodovulum visakhapatnamense]